MKVLVWPRDENPYQGFLYGAMDPGDVEVVYLEAPTSSQTANLCALPFLLAWHRARGADLLHVHWVHPFLVAWARGPWIRGFVQRGFEWFLALAARLGFRIVWTAHNLLPHETVFRDDLAARRTLVARSDAVIAHSHHTATTVEGWGATRVVVVPQGVDGLAGANCPSRSDARKMLDLDLERPVVVFFGNVLVYKGVDLLLDAVASLPADVALEVLVVGRCRDEELRADLERRAVRAGERVRARFTYVSDAELATYLAAADFAVFPFRTVTNSSSVATALGAGVPVIVPDLDVLGDLPANAALRYEQGPKGLVGALTEAAATDRRTRTGLRAGARQFAAERTWVATADATLRLYRDVLEGNATPAPAPVPGELVAR